MILPKIWKSRKCSKPPTRQCWTSSFSGVHISVVCWCLPDPNGSKWRYYLQAWSLESDSFFGRGHTLTPDNWQPWQWRQRQRQQQPNNGDGDDDHHHHHHHNNNNNNSSSSNNNNNTNCNSNNNNSSSSNSNSNSNKKNNNNGNKHKKKKKNNNNKKKKNKNKAKSKSKKKKKKKKEEKKKNDNSNNNKKKKDKNSKNKDKKEQTHKNQKRRRTTTRTRTNNTPGEQVPKRGGTSWLSHVATIFSVATVTWPSPKGNENHSLPNIQNPQTCQTFNHVHVYSLQQRSRFSAFLVSSHISSLVPSGKHTKNYGKSPCFMGKSPFSMGKSPFIAGYITIFHG